MKFSNHPKYKEFTYVVIHTTGLYDQGSPTPVDHGLVFMTNNKFVAERVARDMFVTHNGDKAIKSTWATEHYSVHVNTASNRGGILLKEFQCNFDNKWREIEDVSTEFLLNDGTVLRIMNGAGGAEVETPPGPATHSVQFEMFDLGENQIPVGTLGTLTEDQKISLAKYPSSEVPEKLKPWIEMTELRGDPTKKSEDFVWKLADSVIDAVKGAKLISEAVDAAIDIFAEAKHKQKCIDVLTVKQYTLGLTFSEKKRLNSYG